MFKHLSAIAFIYACTAVAWLILGASVFGRTESQDLKLRTEVGQLWGVEQTQGAPTVTCQYEENVTVERKEDGKTITETKLQTMTYDVPLDTSDIDVALALDHRKKGLLWYTTYAVDFAGGYRFTNRSDQPRDCTVHFRFPAERAIYDGFSFALGDRDSERVDIEAGTLTRTVRLEAGAMTPVRIAYRSQGLDRWWYDFGQNVSQVRGFRLAMTTDFDGIDFPQDGISPTGRTKTDDGWSLAWEYDNLLTGAKIGMDLPDRLNPGPWVGRVTLSAPISLFLFFFMMFILTTLRRILIHPMNYFFLGAAFFSFHLLLAYLVDHITVALAFGLASAVSIALVASYMRMVVGARFALVETAIAQFIYLVLFSATFFLEGFTGLAITLLCVMTLFVVMQLTGRVDWSELFQTGMESRQPAPSLNNLR